MTDLFLVSTEETPDSMNDVSGIHTSIESAEKDAAWYAERSGVAYIYKAELALVARRSVVIGLPDESPDES